MLVVLPRHARSGRSGGGLRRSSTPPEPASSLADFTLFGWSVATIMGVGLFCGAMGKSAQFPLHVWLPDAMAGPTPVSALIHAATMVAAGVYLVARVFRLMTPDALMFISVIGCLTLTLMALIAMVQVDIKKCLAYSTLVAAWLHDLRHGLWGVDRGVVSSDHARLLQGHALPRLRAGDRGLPPRAGHAEDGRPDRKRCRSPVWTFFDRRAGDFRRWYCGNERLAWADSSARTRFWRSRMSAAYEWDDPEKLQVHEGGHGGHDGHAILPAAAIRLSPFCMA